MEPEKGPYCRQLFPQKGPSLAGSMLLCVTECSVVHELKFRSGCARAALQENRKGTIASSITSWGSMPCCGLPMSNMYVAFALEMPPEVMIW